MKHDVMRSAAHNLVDSFASGHSDILKCYGASIFDDLAVEGLSVIEVDFINAKIVNGSPSQWMVQCMAMFEKTLPIFFDKHGLEVSDFSVLCARFSHDQTCYLNAVQRRRVEVTLEDKSGRVSVDRYSGWPLKRSKVTDGQGRIRTVRK